MITNPFFICFSLETGKVEAMFKHDGDALDFKAQYPQAVSDPQPFKLTYDMEPIILPPDKIPGIQYVKIPNPL